MNYYFSSDFEQDEAFMQAFEQYEEMKSGKKTGYFDADQLADFAEYYASKHSYDDAFEVINYALSVHPSNTEILVIKAHILIYQEKIEEAKEIAFSIPESYDRDVKMLKVELFIKDQNLEEADKIVNEIVSLDENNNEDNWIDIAYLYFEAELQEKAIPWFKKAHQADPKNTELRFVLAQCYGYNDEIEKATKLYNELIDKDPYNVNYWFDFGRLYYVLEDYNKSIETYEFALTIDAEHPGSILMVAHCYYQLKNFEKSCEYYERYRGIDSKSGMTVFFIGLCHYNMENYQKCIDDLLEALDLDQGLLLESVDIYNYLALSYSELKDFEKAFYYIDLAAKTDPSFTETFLNKGKIYLKMDDETNAAISFGEALNIKPKDPEIFTEMGTIYLDFKKKNWALKCFEAINYFTPDYEDNHLMLAYIYGSMGDQENFNEHFDKATEGDPANLLKDLELLPEEEQQIRKIIARIKKVMDENDIMGYTPPGIN